MPAVEVIQPEHIAVEQLRMLFDEAGLQTNIDNDGDLTVTSGVTCYVIAPQPCERVLLLAFLGVKDDTEQQQKLEFANRVNNEVSTVRARVNAKGAVLFDYHIPVAGGITGQAIVAATEFFLQATAHAANACDTDDIVR